MKKKCISSPTSTSTTGARERAGVGDKRCSGPATKKKKTRRRAAAATQQEVVSGKLILIQKLFFLFFLSFALSLPPLYPKEDEEADEKKN